MSTMRLYEHQAKALKEMHNGCILCGGVGSGKSRTALAYYFTRNGGAYYDDDIGFTEMVPNPKDLIIITTARKRDTCEWDLELAPFLLSRNPDVSHYKNKVIIDSWNNIRKYKDEKGCFFIFDEQRVVGKGSWVKHFLRIAKANEWILLSATPGDCWSDYIPVFLANGFYKNRTEFTEEHIEYSRFTKYPKIEKYHGVGRLISLRKKILVEMPFERSTVSHHEDVYTSYNVSQYKTLWKYRWNEEKGEPMASASELCYELRKLCNLDQTRLDATMELAKHHKKTIIFYNFDYELEALRRLFRSDKSFEVAEWNGHVHQEIPDSDQWVYLVQYTAGCEGWNCIKTDTIIFFSQSYSYKATEQASGRINRLNTPYHDLYYYHLKSRSQIDIAIGRALSNKKAFNEGKFINGRN